MENIFTKADEVFKLLQISDLNTLHVCGKKGDGKTFLAGLVARKIFDYNFEKYYKSLALLESNVSKGIFMDAFEKDYKCLDLTNKGQKLYSSTVLATNNYGNINFQIIDQWKKPKIYDVIIIDDYELLDIIGMSELESCRLKNSNIKLLIFSKTQTICEYGFNIDFTLQL